MVDYFKTNWTQQMKTNPVANKILNGKPQQDVELMQMRRVWKLPREGPLSINDLWRYSSSASEKYTADEFGDASKEKTDYLLDKFVAQTDDFLQDENARAVRKKKKRKKKNRKQLLNRRQRTGAIQSGQQQGQMHGEERHQEIVIDGDTNVNDGLMQNINVNGPNDMQIARNKQAFGQRAREQQGMQNNDDVTVIQRGGHRIEQQQGDPGSGDEAKIDPDEYDPDDIVDIKDGIALGFEAGVRHGESGMWDNTYVKDYINIHHPKLVPDYYIQALKQQPLVIKPPSVFFSDV